MMQPMNMGALPPPNQFGPPPNQFGPPQNQFGPPTNQFNQASVKLILPQNLIGVVGYYEDLENCKFNWRWIVRDPETNESVRAVTIERVGQPFTILDPSRKVSVEMLKKKYDDFPQNVFFNWRQFDTTNAGEKSVVTLEVGERQYDENNPAPTNIPIPVAHFEWIENT